MSNLKLEVDDIKAACKKAGRNFIFTPGEDRDDEQAYFLFVSTYDGEECVFDSMMTTLQSEYVINILEEAMNMTIERYPQYKDADFNALEGEHIDIMEEIAQDLTEDDDFRLQEYYEVDETEEGSVKQLTVCLKRETITDKDIANFVSEFIRTKGQDIELDETLYAFSLDDEEE